MNFMNCMNKTNIIIISCILVAILIAILYVFRFNILENFTNSYTPNSTNSANSDLANSTGIPIEIMLFSADWCPHCKVARPEWEKVSDKYSNKLIKGHNIIFTDINCTEESAENTKLMSKYKVEGFPTIKLIKNNQVIDFDAKPTQSNLEQFLETVLV